MTFLKMVVHAALAGIYGGLVAAVLLLLDNPGPDAFRGGGWLATALPVVALLYAVAAAVVWPLLYSTMRFFASHPLHLPWLSLRYLVAFHVVNTAVILAAGWLTLSGYRSAFAPRDAERLTDACLRLSVAWAWGAAVSVLPGLRHRAWAQGWAGALALTALLAAPGGLAGRSGDTVVDRALPPAPDSLVDGGRTTPAGPSAAAARRVLLLNFDGADLDTVLTMHAQGKLPGFARLIQEGAYGRLSSVLPCDAPVTRATLVTGAMPHRHGVRSAQARRLLGGGPWIAVVPPGIGFDLLLSPFVTKHSADVSDRTAPALWEIAVRTDGIGEAAGWDVDLDAAGPAPPLSKGQAPDWVGDLLDPDALRLKEAAARALVSEVARSGATDAAVLGALRGVEGETGHGIAAFSFPGLDRLAHVFLRYARPGDFGNVSGREIDLYGPVLERYYRRIDGIIGKALQSAGNEGFVFVTATHGIEIASIPRRLRAELTGGERLSGVHDRAPEGFLFVHGPDVMRGRVFGRGSIVDVAPTALYASGLPVARDSDGSILAGIFSESFTSSHPVTVIRTYGERTGPPTDG
ncbi:MAG: hypothetical protein AUH92_05430 [Acidobacteria bacterium 13_1_40CM_4_69_4]|nr:MAG: hypothetical protein AUH92_05430 [Acidobacteria bacterium 13_1_40CM_4_69_4]